MSSYLSDEYRINQPPQLGDLNLARSVMGGLQGKYNANEAEIQRTLAQFKQLQAIRPEDKEYIAAKIREVQSGISEFSKKNGNISKNYNKNSILNSITSIMDDPIVVDAITSTQNFKGLYAQREALAKKDPNLVNEGNLQDALEQGGYKDYVSGKTTKLGAMQLTPYTDVNKELNERVSKWAKDNGYKTMVNSVNKGMYFEKTKGVSLTKNEIIGFIKGNVDPVMANQMNINARQTYGKLNDEQFTDLAKERLESTNKEHQELLSEQQAKLKTANAENTEIINGKINQIEAAINENKEKLNIGKFERSEQYNFYQRDLFNSLGEAYAKNDITEITYDTTPLDIAKFEFDKEKFAVNSAFEKRKIQLEEFKLDGKNSAGQAMTNGTAIPVIPEEIGEPKSAVDQFRDNFVETNAQLISVLEQQDDVYRSKTTKAEKDQYVRDLMKGGGTINPGSDSPLTPEMANAVNAHKNNYKVYSAHVRGIQEGINPVVTEQYNDMLGAKGLNLTNLSMTMPYTATLLKQKKAFGDLTPEQQDVVRYERVVNQIQFDGKITDSEVTALKTYAVQLEKRNVGKVTFQKSKQLLGEKSPNQSAPVAFFTKGVYGTAIKGAKNMFDLGVNKVLHRVESLFDQESADANLKSRNNEDQKDFEDVKNNLINATKIGLDASWNFQDTNITEVNRGEDSGSGGNLADRFRSGINARVTKAEQEMSKLIPNIQDKQTFSFSTDNKFQKNDAIMLGQIVQRQVGDVPLTGTNTYNLEYFAGQKGYVISYVNADKTLVKTPIIDENLMPKAVINSYARSAGDWVTNPMNPNATLPSVTITKPRNETELVKAVKNLETISGDGFNAVEKLDMIENLLQSPKERIEEVIRDNPHIKGNNEAIGRMKELLESEVTVESRPMEQSGFLLYPVITTKGERKVLSKNDQGLRKLAPVYDSTTNLREQLNMIRRTYEAQLALIIDDYKPEEK